MVGDEAAQQWLISQNFSDQATSCTRSAAHASRDTALCNHCNTLKSTGKGQTQGEVCLPCPPSPWVLITDGSWNLFSGGLNRCCAEVTKQLPAAEECSATPHWSALAFCCLTSHQTQAKRCSQCKTQEINLIQAQTLQASKVPSLKLS